MRLVLSTGASPDNKRKTISTHVGADGYALQFAARDSEGGKLDLTGITVTITADYGGTKKIDDKACTPTDLIDGEFEYTPTASEADTSGPHLAQVKLVDGSAKVTFLEEFVLNLITPVEDI